ncbi:hypothetical protein GCM10022223_01370 [Kineosporia mesophila]|uniref:Uncharacterized protein n=2 Tax=Kineosporia mesophila TaxID=566012 RepID=A0ABP6YYQ7_9ACTN
MAELVFHMHSDASEGWFGQVDAMDACYRATFNYYGVMGEPGRIHCPEDLTPLRPIPLPPRVDPFVESYLHPEDAP